MYRNLVFLFFIFWLAGLPVANAQNNRIHTSNQIGWCAFLGTVKLSDKFGIHAEYQWRRSNYITQWQQGLLRVGLNYTFNPRVLFRVGYAWAETYPYGDIPLNGFGKDFTEHRFFEMVQLSHQEGVLNFSHRFMLEQRFVGRYASANQTTEDAFPFMNRARYMIRLQVPLKGKEVKDKVPYMALYDEVFVGFGKNVNANVFDQNRIGFLFGYRFNQMVRMEGGYINQILQYGRQIGGKNIFQTNNGFIINTYLNFL